MIPLRRSWSGFAARSSRCWRCLGAAASAAARRRWPQRARERIGVGTEVMTTSGLYGTVVAAQRRRARCMLSIAPGRRGEVGAGRPARRRVAARQYRPAPIDRRRADERTAADIRRRRARRRIALRRGRSRSRSRRRQARVGHTVLRPRRRPVAAASDERRGDLPRGTTRRNAARRALLPRAARAARRPYAIVFLPGQRHTPEARHRPGRRHAGDLHRPGARRRERRRRRRWTQARQIIEDRVNGTGVTGRRSSIQGTTSSSSRSRAAPRPTSPSSARPPC